MSEAGRETPSAPPAGSVLDIERILAMAEDIGDFFAPYPPVRAREGVRNHLRTYWDPRMRESLLSAIEAGVADLPPHVVDGARLLACEDAAKASYYGPPKA